MRGTYKEKNSINEICIPCLASSKSIKLQVIRKLKYVFHCKHTKVINYSFSKTFQTSNHFISIKAFSKHRANFYSTFKCHHKEESREESLHRTIKKTAKRPTRHHIKQKSTKEANRQKTLIAYGITRQKQSKQQHKTTNNIPSSFQQQLQFDSALKDNYNFGDKLNKLKEYNLRILYLNINGIESDLNKLTQLCLNLCSKGSP